MINYNKQYINKNMRFVECHHEFYVKKEIIWKIISTPSNLELFHPFCKENKIISWPGKESVDQLTYLNGLNLIRTFHSWEENKGYELFIGRKDARQSLVNWELKSNSLTNGCCLSIRVYPHIYNSKKSFIQTLLFTLLVKPRLKKYLKSVLLGLNWYILNKKKVPKNLFGKHSWFS